MTKQHKYEIKKDYQNDFMLKNQLGDFSNRHDFLLQQKLSFKTTEKRNGLVKRISPFMIISFCLPLLFLYLFMKDENDKWFLLLLFVFVEPNILIMDFALRTYYEERKKLSMWIIEMILIFVAGYFLLR